jgi:large subunit ribosomal protein L17
MLASLAADLFRLERVRTTETKAKRLRPVAERLITWGKTGTVHARRQALAVIEDRDVVHKLFSEIAPRFSQRDGGYTRILKLGPRKGDAAMMALIELVEGEAEEETRSAAAASPEPRRRRRVLGRRGSRTAPEQPVSDESEEGLEDPIEALQDAGAFAEAPEDTGEDIEKPPDKES